MPETAAPTEGVTPTEGTSKENTVVDDVAKLKQALEAEREAHKTTKSRARDTESKAKENETAAQRLAQLEESTKSELEKQLDAVRKETDKTARTEVTAQFTRRIVQAELKAAAGGKLNDPADAVRMLDVDSFQLDENHEADSAAIAKAIDDLIASKPYLAVGKQHPGGINQGPQDDTHTPAAKTMAEAIQARIAAQRKRR